MPKGSVSTRPSAVSVEPPPAGRAGGSEGLLSVRTLGRFEVALGERVFPQAAWQRRQATDVFKMLLASPGYRVLKDQVLEWLRPEAESRSAHNTYYKALCHLRAALEKYAGYPGIRDMILGERDILFLAPGLIAREDATEFEQAARAARASGMIADYERAVALYSGDYLPEDLYEPWAETRRVALRELYQQSLRALTRLYVEEGRVEDALSVAQRSVQLDPLDEEACRLVMVCYTRLGRRADALREFRACVAALRRELNAAPARETLALYRAIDAGASLGERPGGQSEQLGHRASGTAVKTMLRAARVVTPLVGRGAELQRLHELLAVDAPTSGLSRELGLSGLTLISGEPGIGKSCLLQEMIQIAAASDVAVFAGTCSDHEGKLPYGAFVEALRGFLDNVPEVWSRLRHDRRAWPLVHLLPELGAPPWRTAPAGRTEGTGQPQARAAENPAPNKVERQALFDAVIYLLVAIAHAHRGALLALDDLQWASGASLQLLHYLVRKTRGEPLLVIGTARSEALAIGCPLGKLIIDLRQRNLYAPLHLQRLSTEETAAYVAHALAEHDAAGKSVAPGLLRYIYQLTEGNPLFIREMVRSLRDARLIVPVDGHWAPAGALATAIAHPRARSAPQRLPVPETVKDIFAERLERLTPDQHRLLALIATTGQSIGEDILRYAALATGFALNEFVDALDMLLQAGLLVEEEDRSWERAQRGRSGEGGLLYRFSHALVAETVWERESGARRHWLHEQIGQAREAVYRARPNGQEQLRVHAAQLAHHFEQAEDTARALQYHLLAADQARRLFANNEVGYHYQVAIDLLESNAHPDVETLALAWQGLGEAREWRADHEGAQRCFEQALQYAARPEQRATLYRMLGALLRDVGRYQEAVAMYQRGEAELAEAPHTVEWARLQLSALSAYVSAGRYEEGLSKVERALPVLLNCGLEAEVARGHSQAAFASYYAGNLAAAEMHARQGLEHARIAGDRVREGVCGHQLAVVQHTHGATGEALAQIRQAIALKEELGHQVTLAGAYLELAHIHCTRNEAADCMQASRQALELARETGSLPDEAYGLFLLGRGYELSGAWERALASWEDAEAVLQVAPHPEMLCMVHSHAASLLLRRGELAAARLRGNRAIAMDWQVAGQANIAFGLGTCARLALLSGNMAEAAELAGRALRLVEGMDIPEAEARASLICGAVEFAAGRVAAARRHAQHGASLADTYHFVHLQLAARRWLGLIAAQEQRWDIIERLLAEGRALMEAAPLAYSTAVFASTFADLLDQRGIGDAADLRRRAVTLLTQLQAKVLPVDRWV
jgi:DNA-binding SARP family transcriptional activator